MKKCYHFLTYLFFISCLLFFNSCEKRKLKKTYEGCCELESQTFIFDGLESIYIPNIFTPNSDGYNDLFYLHGSPNIEIINSFVIKDEDDDIVFQATDITSNDPSDGWDGTLDGNGIDNLKGLFSYAFTATTTGGEVKSSTGKVCAYRCTDSGFPSDNLDNCHFPGQYNGLGELDETLPTNEMNCF